MRLRHLVAVAFLAASLLPGGVAFGNSHTINGIYHGNHQDWDSKNRKYFHAWQHHGHGEKGVFESKCNRDYTVYDCSTDIRCGAHGAVTHVHCTAYNSGTDYADFWESDPSEGSAGNCWTDSDSSGWTSYPVYTDGHGNCDHVMSP